MQIQTYNHATVMLMRHTAHPSHLTHAATNLTQSKKIEGCDAASTALLQFLQTAEHQSVLEHASVTFAIRGVSRSLLAQLTRHRTGKFTSSSQHYSNHADMPAVISPVAKRIDLHQEAFDKCLDVYLKLIEAGEPPEEARQVLPNACAVNIIWTVDMRNLAGFIRQRLCRRNVREMYMFAQSALRELYSVWPEYASTCGPPCFTDGHCNQGKMSCGHAVTGPTADEYDDR